MKFDVIIVGAGVAGLSMGWRLLNENRSLRICFLEMDKVGGKCATLLSKNAAFDIGGHFLHSFDQFPKELHHLFKGWDRYDKHGITFSADGTMFDGPIQNHFPKEGGEVVDYTSLESFYRSKFGDKLAEMFFLPYNRKLLNRYDLASSKPPSKLDIRSPTKGEKAYNNSFLYPSKKGIQSLTDGLFDIIRPSSILFYDKMVRFGKGFVDTAKNGRLYADTVILTCPIREWLTLSAMAPTVTVVNGFGVPKFDPPPNWTWAYLAQPKAPFFRVGNYAGCGSGVWGGRTPFYAETSQPLENPLKAVSKIFDFAHIVSVQSVAHAYPVYAKDDESLKFDYINKCRKKRIFWAGRYGTDTWFSVAETMTDSIAIADMILS